MSFVESVFKAVAPSLVKGLSSMRLPKMSGELQLAGLSDDGLEFIYQLGQRISPKMVD